MHQQRCRTTEKQKWQMHEWAGCEGLKAVDEDGGRNQTPGAELNVFRVIQNNVVGFTHTPQKPVT